MKIRYIPTLNQPNDVYAVALQEEEEEYNICPNCSKKVEITPFDGEGLPHLTCERCNTDFIILMGMPIKVKLEEGKNDG